jgi:HlyD family secretion protein
MDIPRQIDTRRRFIKRVAIGAGLLLAVVLITVGLSRLKPAAPTVERATVWMDTVKRGEMLRQVRGPGTLVPEEIRWIPAVTEGRVEKRVVLPGTPVKAETVILELSNPELQQSAQDAELQLRAAEAEFANLKVQLQSQLFNQQAQAATVEAAFHQARLQAEADEDLARQGLIADLTRKLSASRAAELATRHELEQKRLKIATGAVEAQLVSQRARMEQSQALYALRRKQVADLKVRAGIEGVLQELPVEVGQRVAPGTNLARVARPERLKAELRIAQTQAKDIEVGQTASIDTRNGLIPGRVVRIDPAVREGTVTVDVALLGELPRGARPDLDVDGTIEIERLADVLYVGRPAYGQPDSTVGIFKLESDGVTAVRVQVKLGRSSVTTIEVVSGLKEGDTVILSDTSAWDAFDRIRLG